MNLMKKYLFPLLCVLIFTCSCQTSSSIGSNPVADGQEMMYQAMTCMKEGKPDKANEILGKYLDCYADADSLKKSEFCKASTESYWYEMMKLDSDEWKPFLEKMRPVMQWYMESGESMSSIPNFNRLRDMQGKELGRDR